MGGRITGRAALLAVALGVAVLALALPLKIFLGQQQSVASLSRQAAADSRQISALRNQLALWSSPPYIEAQAQARLHMVRPGQTVYLPLGKPAAKTARPGWQAAGTGAAASTPWFTQLWSSVDRAGSAAAHPGG